MPNTYTQIYIHYVFATRSRMRFLHDRIRKELYDYIAGYTKEMKGFLQCIGGMEDHIHILVGLPPTLSVADFAQKIKANSSRFINEKGWAFGKFKWQEGYGAFSVSQSGLENARSYINHQQEHHAKRSFSSEFEELLNRYKVNYDKQYLFEPCMED
jgi:putative transposase